jgi:hypothetical protein
MSAQDPAATHPDVLIRGFDRVQTHGAESYVFSSLQTRWTAAELAVSDWEVEPPTGALGYVRPVLEGGVAVSTPAVPR